MTPVALTVRESFAVVPSIRKGVRHWLLVDPQDHDRVSKHRWSVMGHGYVQGRVEGKRVYLHRFLIQPMQTEQVDHINGDKLDNRRVNLRTVTPMQNSQNIPMRASNTSGYRGVSYVRDADRYKASVTVSGREIYLGRYRTAREAGEAAARERQRRGFKTGHKSA